MTAPTILLIHGAFGTPACFDRLVPYLERMGYPAVQRATFPSSNPDDPTSVSALGDIEYVRDRYLLPLIEGERKEVVVVVHSYGGVVAGGAALGLSREDRRRKGLDGGVLGLVFIAANIVKEGESLLESAGGQWPPWFMQDKPRAGLALMDPLMETMYNDCDAALEPELTAAMVPQGYHSLETKASAPCWAEEAYTGRLAYVRTTLDGVNPAWAQDFWMQGTGVHWDVVNMETSHAPYISQPEKLAEIIVGFAKGFTAL